MSQSSLDRVSNLGSNVALIVVGLVVVVLAYGFASQYLIGQSDPVRADNPAGLVGEIIQVEVRNGGGVDGAAASMTRFLRRQGFDVVEVGDYSSYDQEETVIVDRVGDIESARRVAKAIGIPDDRVTQDIRHDLYLDASIIVGRDFHALKPFRNNSDQ